MNERKVQEIRQLSEKITQQVQVFVEKHQIDPSSDTFSAKLLKNCLEMKKVSLAKLSMEELVIIQHYWEMMGAIELK
ncbi:hypothetical protein OO382_002655 [Listeria monocytogenes]|nr:hypothetical protein [Listeria monocytogenes]